MISEISDYRILIFVADFFGRSGFRNRGFLLRLSAIGTKRIAQEAGFMRVVAEKVFEGVT